METREAKDTIDKWLILTKITVEYTKTPKEVTAKLGNNIKAEKNKKQLPTTAVGETAEIATHNLFQSLSGGFAKTHRGNFNFPWI